jgi:ubiquinone/menaquinone biosynthesis C-methylase UbiE
MEVSQLIPETKIRNLFGPFDDKEYYFNLGKEQAEKITQWLSIKPEDKILDLGCGCGRIAIHFLNYLSEQGKYIGIDIDKDFISYCSNNISMLDDNFQFHFIDVYNGAYGREGKLKADEVILPVESESMDVVILWSLFTHMNLTDIESYLKEVYRVLKKGGRFIASLNLYNKFVENQMKMNKSQLDIKYRVDENSYTVFEEVPEWGFAHNEDKVKELCLESGFYIKEIKYGIWHCKELSGEFHDCIIGEK